MLGVRLALENMPDDDFVELDSLCAEYDAGFLGLCYDSGHGNIGSDGLAQLERRADRLAAIHLHDNDGSKDRHDLPFTGTVDWPRLTRLLAVSAYDGCISLEANQRGEDVPEEAWLARAHTAAVSLTEMVAAARTG
jgi:sugar phosphate isomerase/epimerase